MAVSKPAPKARASSGQGSRNKGSNQGSKNGATKSRNTANRTRSSSGRSGPRPGARRQGAALYLWGAVALVVVAVVVIVLVAVAGGSGTKRLGGHSLLPAGVVNAVTGVPQSVLTGYSLGISSGAAAVNQLPVPTAGVQGAKGPQPPLTSGGKPEVFYFGAQYCPYCGAERWAMVNALARFGTFSNLGATHSSSTDVYPNTATFNFVGASYSSPYITFASVEYQDNLKQPLQQPTKAEQQLLAKYNAAPYVAGQAGSIPFIDFGNQYIQSGANYDPGLLAGLDYATIAAEMQNQGNNVGQAIDAAANYLTAAICQITNNQPSNACSEPYVSKAVAAMATAAKSGASSTGNATPGVATGG